jgi:hypothetical protein
MNNKIKLNYYDILNSIRMQYLKSKIPFNIINDNSIKLTYNEIKLKYINNKNYFIKIDQKQPVVSALDRKNEYKIEKLEKVKNKEDQKKFTTTETSNYLERRKQYAKEKENKDESKNYKKEFTADETAAYLERRKQYAKEKENKDTNDSQIVAGYQKVSFNKIQILVFF